MINLYKSIFEDAGIGYWIWNLSDKSTYISSKLMSMLGYSEEELSISLEALEVLIHDIIIKEDYEIIQNHFKEHISSQSKKYFSQQITREE